MRKLLAGVVSLALTCTVLGWKELHVVAPVLAYAPPVMPEEVKRQIRERQDAPLNVALVFGRAEGCKDASPELIRLVAQESMNAGIPPKVLAATVAVESHCDAMAISKSGAVGLTQVVVRVHKGRFDFASKYNLLNPKDNVYVGSRILAGYIAQYGLDSGVHHYNGMGQGCDACDAAYSSKVLTLANAK